MFEVISMEGSSIDKRQIEMLGKIKAKGHKEEIKLESLPFDSQRFN